MKKKTIIIITALIAIIIVTASICFGAKTYYKNYYEKKYEDALVNISGCLPGMHTIEELERGAHCASGINDTYTGNNDY